jgi:hypothetical protein
MNEPIPTQDLSEFVGANGQQVLVLVLFFLAFNWMWHLVRRACRFEEVAALKDDRQQCTVCECWLRPGESCLCDPIAPTIDPNGLRYWQLEEQEQKLLA